MGMSSTVFSVKCPTPHSPSECNVKNIPMWEFGIKVIKMNWCSVCILLCSSIYYNLNVYNQALSLILLALNYCLIVSLPDASIHGSLEKFGITCYTPTHRTSRCHLRSFYIILLPFISLNPQSNYGNCRG